MIREAAPVQVPAPKRSSSTQETQDQSQSPATNSELSRYIPQELMTKLETARVTGDMVGERRVVTMLFCDLKGSTAAAEQLDPEDWTEIMNGAFAHMIKPVYQYEGTVARLMGDALLAFFGAPIAHEDDPQRAILAGLDISAGIKPYRQEINEKYGVDLDVRVGINTGLVVVGAVGSDLRIEYSALGDAINLAARMEQTAKPGTVQIAHDTYKLVKNLFEFEDLGGIGIKGKEEPVLAYRVLERKGDASQIRGIEGLHADMVGREAELLTLRNIINDLKQGVGRIVFVLGEAGLGKTRLANEAREIFKTVGIASASWLETSSLSYETNQAYGLFQRLIRRMSGINHNDAPQVVREKLENIVETLEPSRHARATQVFEVLFGLENENNDLPMDGDTFKRELYETVCLWWKARFSTQPAVLVFDDMHWGDSASIELLRQLLPLTGEIPLVLLCALRTERNAPAWQIRITADEEHSHRYTELSLRPLSEAESNELINRLLDNAELPQGLRSSILEKSAGNPFFIEEVVRTLIDNGVLISEEKTIDGQIKRVWRATREGADFAIPDNLQSLLSARLDRLEDLTRGTLQLASVIGRSFHHRILQEVDEDRLQLDQNLGTLLRLDLIRESARVPEVEYAFRNPLTQEAVYKTILVKRRRAFHRRVGEAMELIYADRLDGIYGLLVHHFTIAEEREKAIAYSRKAAHQAIALFSYNDAVQILRAALSLVEEGKLKETHQILLEELGDTYNLLRGFEQAITAYHDALHIWETLPDKDTITGVRLYRKIIQLATEAKWNTSLESYEHMRETASESLAELEPILEAIQNEPHVEIVRAFATVSFEAWRNQNPPDWERAQRYAQLAVDMAERLEEPVVLSRALGALANVLDGRSLLRDHLQVALKRLEVSADPDMNNPIERIDAISGAGMALMYVGEYEQAINHLQEAETLAIESQAIGQQTATLNLQEQCLFRLDRWDEALSIETRWRELEKQYPRERVGPTCFSVAMSGSIHAMRGNHSKAKAYEMESFDFMVAISGTPDQWQRNQHY